MGADKQSRTLLWKRNIISLFLPEPLQPSKRQPVSEDMVGYAQVVVFLATSTGASICKSGKKVNKNKMRHAGKPNTNHSKVPCPLLQYCGDYHNDRASREGWEQGELETRVS